MPSGSASWPFFPAFANFQRASNARPWPGTRFIPGLRTRPKLFRRKKGDKTMHDIIPLTRDCEVTQIPIGNPMMLPKGTPVRITQALGGAYTVVTDHGYMVRISERDADALGKEVPKQAQSDAAQSLSLEQLVWNQMKTC